MYIACRMVWKVEEFVFGEHGELVCGIKRGKGVVRTREAYRGIPAPFPSSYATTSGVVFARWGRHCYLFPTCPYMCCCLLQDFIIKENRQIPVYDQCEGLSGISTREFTATEKNITQNKM